MKNQVKYHSVHDDNDTIIIRERLIECLQELKYEDKKKDDKGVVTVEMKRKVDDATIEAIIKEFDENSNEQPITSLEHYQKRISRDKFETVLKDYKIDDKDLNSMLEKLVGENTINNLPSQLLYKMGDRLISRENFLHMLKKMAKN